MHDMPPRGQAAAGAPGQSVPNVDLLSSACLALRTSRPGEGEAISPDAVHSVTDFYAHALMAGGQATAAYEAFGEFLEARGEEAMAALFRELAVAEMQRTGELFCRTASLPLPQLPRWRYSWLYCAPPDPSARDVVAHLLTPRAALSLALAAVRREAAWYERLAGSAGYSEVRVLARELAAEKLRCGQRLGDALATLPAAFAWSEYFDGLCPRS